MGFAHVPGNPEPAGAEEVWFEGRRGAKLRALLAPGQASGPFRGSVLVLPGRTEFIEKYFEVVCELQRRGFAVVVLDWRGQGLSDRLLRDPHKNHCTTFEDLIDDLALAMRRFEIHMPHPHIVLAHSMGGAIALRALQTNRLTAAAAVFTAPMWDISALTPPLRLFTRVCTLFGLGARTAPTQDPRWRRQPFEGNPLTHDRARFERGQDLVEAEPKLALAGPTIRWISAALEMMQGLAKPDALARVATPCLVLTAGDEQIVDFDAQGRIAGALAHGKQLIIPESRHEILMETDGIRGKFWAAFDGFVGELAQRKPSANAPAET